MQHEAARPKGRSLDDEPMAQPMRATRQGEVRRNPSTDQKRVRRANMRKSADWTPGHVHCRSCGNEAHPMMSGGATGPECSVCGSYEVSKTRPTPTGGTPYPENSRYLHQGDYALTGPGKEKHASLHEATVLNTQAWMLNPGDQIRMPTGKTQKVTRVRPHETSQKHVYVDTDGGTALALRTDPFDVVPFNSQQQELPGYGTPGGNTNHAPGLGGGDNMAPSTQCPVCGGNGTLTRQGDHYTCSRCGYKEQFGGAGGHSFSDSPRQVQTAAKYSTINSPMKSVVARRAEAMLNQKENQ